MVSQSVDVTDASIVQASYLELKIEQTRILEVLYRT